MLTYLNVSVHGKAYMNQDELAPSLAVPIIDSHPSVNSSAPNATPNLLSNEATGDIMAETNKVEYSIQGTFTREGFLAGGYFIGWFLYAPTTTLDSNSSISNVGVFEVAKFQIDVFDANQNLIDSLNENNSVGKISLQDRDPSDTQADTYTFSAVPKTSGNDFFEHGEFNIIFDWTTGGDPSAVPNQAPGEFISAYFSSYAAAGGWEGIVNPQQVEVAAIANRNSLVKLGVQGNFSNSGFLANGRFEGWFSYKIDTNDTNEAIANVGSFSLKDFYIELFNADGELVSTLDKENSTGQISLKDLELLDNQADTYILSIVPNTETNINAFFETGELSLTFNWILGGDPNIAPTFLPQAFESGSFASFADAGGWDGIIDPQQIQSVTIKVIDSENQPLEPIRIEAEAMELSGYRIEKSPFASGGKLASLVGKSKEEIGLATVEFSGPTGKYDIVVGYIEENDGQATLEITHNGSFLTGWDLITEGRGYSTITKHNFMHYKAAAGLTIQQGDSFNIKGIEHGKEHARFDYIEFIPTKSTAAVGTSNIGNGLIADYYSDSTLSQKALSRIDPTVNFNWGLSGPNPTLAADMFSVQWHGYVSPTHASSYSFRTTTDDGVRLWVNNQLLIDNWGSEAPPTGQAPIFLESDKFYPIMMQYYESQGTAVAQLEWAYDNQPFEVIPQSQLFTTQPTSI